MHYYAPNFEEVEGENKVFGPVLLSIHLPPPPPPPPHPPAKFFFYLDSL